MARVLRLLPVAIALILVSANLAWSQPAGAGSDPVAGARVFDAKGCVKCHAIEGSGGKVGPDLARVAKPHSFYDLAAAMWNHLPRMTERMKQLGVPRPKLDADEAKNLVGFLYTLGYFDRPGNAESGKRLFTAKRCAECHSGAGPGPDLAGLKQFGSPLYAAAAMWNHGPQMGDAMKAKGVQRPTFTAAELRDLIAYLSPSTGASPTIVFVVPGDAETGRVRFAEKQCVQCHAASGVGGSVGPSLTDKAVRRSPLEFAAAMWNKAPAMTTAMAARNIMIPQLTPAEMADLVAYLYSSGYFAGGSPNRGWATLSNKGCLACHAVFGERGKPASNLTAAKGVSSPTGLLADLWNHTTVPVPAPGGGKTPWPTFTAQEMADLAALLQGIRRPQ
ncbi:MAG TPA: c-type cytochrome [Methylomirabilota bacterium]|nr:c-type cytochrome [Methylomirabilota bacterium]